MRVSEMALKRNMTYGNCNHKPILEYLCILVSLDYRAQIKN